MLTVCIGTLLEIGEMVNEGPENAFNGTEGVG